MYLPMDPESHMDIVQNLTVYPLEFVRHGSTEFIHAHSYQRRRSSSLDLILDICHLHNGNLSTPSADAAKIERRLECALLLTANSTVSFVDTLAFVQSLCLLQIMLLFSPTSTQEQYARGETYLHLLKEWTHKLWASAPTALPSTLSKHEAYVFAEAVRRTIIISHKIQGCHRVARTGFFRHTIFVESLPFGENSSLWDTAELNNAMDATYPRLMSYRELTDRWDEGLIDEATTFERMLLVGCKGKAAVDKRLGPFVRTI